MQSHSPDCCYWFAMPSNHVVPEKEEDEEEGIKLQLGVVAGLM